MFLTFKFFYLIYVLLKINIFLEDILYYFKYSCKFFF